MLYLKLLFFDMMLFYVFWLYDDPSYDKGNYKCDQRRDDNVFLQIFNNLKAVGIAGSKSLSSTVTSNFFS